MAGTFGIKTALARLLSGHDETSALVPLHPRGAGCHRVVVPLQSERLLAEHVGLETPPSLELEIVERAAVSTKPVRYARRKVDQRAGFDFLAGVADLDHAAALEGDVSVRCTARVGAGADVPVIRRRSAVVIMHLARLNGVGRREPFTIEK